MLCLKIEGEEHHFQPCFHIICPQQSPSRLPCCDFLALETLDIVLYYTRARTEAQVLGWTENETCSKQKLLPVANAFPQLGKSQVYGLSPV